MLPCIPICLRNERGCASVATSSSHSQCPRWSTNNTFLKNFTPRNGSRYADKTICQRILVRVGSGGSCGGEDDGNNVHEDRRSLGRLIENPVITGSELRQRVYEKWNREYDVRLTRRGRRMYLQVFWKYLGQKSFPLTEEEYQMQLDAGECSLLSKSFRDCLVQSKYYY